MNNPQYFKVGSDWVEANYPTKSACWTAQAGVAPGDIVMLCKGHLGNSQNLSGAHTHALYIYSDGITYKGHNESELATVNNLNISVTSPVFINDILPITTNQYVPAFSLGTDSLIAKRMVFDNQTTGSNAIAIMGHYPNSRIEYFIARGGSDVTLAGYNRGTNLFKFIVHGGADKGIEASAGTEELLVTDGLSFGNGGNDFDNGAIGQTRCASEDGTGTHTGYSSADLKNFASKDYRVKADSPLHDLGIGAFFEEVVTGTEQSATLASTQQLSQVQISSLSYENSINAVVTESLAQSQIVNPNNQSLIAAVTTEQKVDCSLQAIASVNNITAITTEQRNDSVLSDIDNEQLIYAVQSEQLAQAITVSVTSNDAQGINVVVTEQVSNASVISAQEAQQLETVITEQVSQAITSTVQQTQPIGAITTEQIANVVIVNVDEFSGVLISVVKTEQLTQAISLNAGIESAISIVITEQLAQHLTQKISVELSVSAAVTEQLSHSELISIVQQNLAQEYDIDFDSIVLESTTPQYTIESITPIYILEQTH